MMDRRRFLSAAFALTVTAVLSSCGGSSKESDAAGPDETAGSQQAPLTEVTIVSTGLNYDKTLIYIPSGMPVTVTYENRHKGVPHNVHVLSGIEKETPVEPGVITQELTFTAPSPGSYDFLCDVHPEMMKGVFRAV